MTTTATQLNPVDEFIVTQITELIANNEDAAFELIHSEIFTDEDHKDHIINTLIARGILFGCPHGKCDDLDTKPFDDGCDYRADGYTDESVSTTEVYNRAYAHFGNHELAREATELYPGDFI